MKRPYLVMPDRVCVPLEGAWRIALLRGDWYVLGHHCVVPCGSKHAAESMLEELRSQSDIDLLANEAISGLDRIPENWETDSLAENDLRAQRPGTHSRTRDGNAMPEASTPALAYSDRESSR